MRETQLTFSLSFQHSFSHIFLSLTFFKHKLKRDFIENDYIYIQVYFSLNVYSRAFIITSSNYTSSTIKKKTIKEKVRHLLRRMPHSFLTMNHTKLLICLIPNNREGKKNTKIQICSLICVIHMCTSTAFNDSKLNKKGKGVWSVSFKFIQMLLNFE